MIYTYIFLYHIFKFNTKFIKEFSSIYHLSSCVYKSWISSVGNSLLDINGVET